MSWWYIAEDYGVGADDRIISYGYAAEYCRSGPNVDPISQLRLHGLIPKLISWAPLSQSDILQNPAVFPYDDIEPDDDAAPMYHKKAFPDFRPRMDVNT